MSLGLEFAFSPRLGLEVSPALVAFTELLILPSAEVQTVIDDELRDNPALERLEPAECPLCRGGWSRRCPICADPDGARGAPGLGEAGDVAVADTDVAVLRHLVRLETATADGPVVDHVIDSLDEHGLIDRPVEQIAEEAGFERAAVDRVIDTIRRVGPPGVGAASIVECLVLQLEALALDDDTARLASEIIVSHLPALARGHFASIAAATGASRGRVEAILDLIRTRLRPYPAYEGAGVAATRPAVPEVLIHHGSAGPVVTLVEPARIRLRARPGRPGTAQARAFLGTLADRWETLRRIVEHIVERQAAFLVHGPTALVPLTRAEVATVLGLHESTVSRAVADKHALLPGGTTMPLSAFFTTGGGLLGALRTVLSTAEVPLSDQQVADRLRDRGYPVARRTVAKHRARLGYRTAALR